MEIKEIRCEECPAVLQRRCQKELKAWRTIRVLPCQSDNEDDIRALKTFRRLVKIYDKRR